MLGRLRKILGWLWEISKGYRAVWLVLLSLDILLPLMEVGTAFLSKAMVDHAVAKETGLAVRAVLQFGGLLLVIQVFQIAESLISGRQAVKCAHEVRSRLLERMDKTRWSYLQSFHSGDLMTRMTGDVQVVADSLIQGVPKAVSTVVKVVASFGALMWFDPMLAWLALAAGPIFGLAVRFAGKKLTKLSERMLAAQSRYMSQVQEWVQHLELVKVFGNRRAVQERLDRQQAEFLQIANRQILAGSAMSSFFAVGFNAGYLLAFIWGVFRLAKGSITFGTMTAFIQLVVQLQGPFAEAGDQFASLLGTAVSAERLMQIANGPQEKSADDDGAELPAPDGGLEICLDHVRFGYGEAEPVFRAGTLNVPSCSLTAIMGPSGEGKSTLVRLLLALVSPEAGRVFFRETRNGMETDASAATRGWLAYVPQDSGLVSGSVLENVRMGRPDASEDEVEIALRTACAWDFLAGTGDGIRHLLGEEGSGLSVGQLQRIAIARALVRHAPILLLDEATSALDVDLEAQILKNLSAMAEKCTILIITHRETAAAACNRIFRLDQGVFSGEEQECERVNAIRKESDRVNAIKKERSPDLSY